MVVMQILHSNAGEERIFSLINKNTALYRRSLNIGGILFSSFEDTH